jgi:hypothetical protein
MGGFISPVVDDLISPDKYMLLSDSPVHDTDSTVLAVAVAVDSSSLETLA